MELLDKMEADCLGRLLMSGDFGDPVTISDELPSIEGAEMSYNTSDNTIRIRNYNDYAFLEDMLHHNQFSSGSGTHAAQKEVEGKVAIMGYMERQGRSWELSDGAIPTWGKIELYLNDPTGTHTLPNGKTRSNYDYGLDGIANMGYYNYVNDYEAKRDQYRQFENLDYVRSLETMAGCAD